MTQNKIKVEVIIHEGSKVTKNIVEGIVKKKEA